jgi:hypothetical protein
MATQVADHLQEVREASAGAALKWLGSLPN